MAAANSPTVPRSGPFLLAAVIGAFGVFYAVFARVALHAFPFSGDEYSYVLQAELFARGLLHSPTPAHAELLRVDHVILEPWVCSKYPPGTSALLALGVRWGVPWLVTPIEGVVALAAMAAAARRLLGPREALLAVGLLGAGAALRVPGGVVLLAHGDDDVARPRVRRGARVVARAGARGGWSSRVRPSGARS